MIYFVEQSVVEVMTRFFSFLPHLSVLGAQLLNCFISCLTAHCKIHQGWKKVTKMLHFYFNIIYIYISETTNVILFTFWLRRDLWHFYVFVEFSMEMDDCCHLVKNKHLIRAHPHKARAFSIQSYFFFV